jgi:hypothetical protein
MAKQVTQEKTGKKKPKIKNGISYVDKMCTTFEFRVAFPVLEEAESYKGQKERFSIIMLFEDDIDLTKSAVKNPKPGKPYASLTKAIHNAKVEMWGKDKADWPRDPETGEIAIKGVIEDGNKKANWEGFPGHLFAKAWSYRQPKIFGTKKNPDGGFQEIPPESIYGGCYCRAVVVAFAYDDPNCGVGLMLTSIQKIRDGESFVGGSDGSEFGDVEDENEEEESAEEEEDDELPVRRKASRQDEDDNALWS